MKADKDQEDPHNTEMTASWYIMGTWAGNWTVEYRTRRNIRQMSVRERKDIRMTDRNCTSQQIGCHKWMWALIAHIVSYWLYVLFCSESNIIMAVCAIVQWILYHIGRMRHLQWNQLHTVCMSHQWILITSRSLSSTSVNMSTADQISIQDLPSGLFLSVSFF